MIFNFKKPILFFGFIVFIFLCGAITQKYYGLGNIINIIYPYYSHEKPKNFIKNSHFGKMEIFLLAGQSREILRWYLKRLVIVQ